MTTIGNSCKIAFVTLGCPKNEADSNRMKNLIEQSNYQVADVDDADVIVVNTCAFITEATEQGIEVIFDLLSDDNVVRRGTKVVVAGCMPSRFGTALEESLFEVEGFLPAHAEETLGNLLESITHVPFIMSGRGQKRSLEGVSAYVKISDGCDRFCSYCTIPFIRGRYHSFTLDAIMLEVQQLVEQGALEIVLIGQNTGIWGHDIAGSPDLASLLDTLATTFPDTWFRVMYLQPEGVDDRLLDTFNTHSNICKYLDIPLQHATSRILQEMNRTGSGDEYLALVEKIRNKVPGIVLRSTFIAGFPGETRADALELKRFLESACFDYAGVFVYSQEDGTRAGMRDDQVPMRTRKARAQRLRDLCDEIGFKRASSHVGDVVEVIVEALEDNGDSIELIARSFAQAPDIDGVVHLPMGCASIGDVLTVKLTDSFCYDFEGEPV